MLAWEEQQKQHAAELEAREVELQTKQVCVRRGAQQPENAKGGGKTAGGGGKTSRGEPPRKTVSDPPPSPRYVPSPPNVISLIKSLTNTQNFPQVTPSKTVFGGSPKMVFLTGHLCEVLPPPRCFAPPFGSAQNK